MNNRLKSSSLVSVLYVVDDSKHFLLAAKRLNRISYESGFVSSKINNLHLNGFSRNIMNILFECISGIVLVGSFFQNDTLYKVWQNNRL